MQITQPTDSIVTDKTKAESEKLAQLRNNATIIEGEVARLKGLVNAEKYEIEQLVKQKADLTEQIPMLELKKTTLDDLVTSLTATLADLGEQKAKTEQKIASDTEAINEKLNACTELEQELEKQALLIASAQTSLEERHKKLDTEEEELNKKLAKLKDIIG